MKNIHTLNPTYVKLENIYTFPMSQSLTFIKCFTLPSFSLKEPKEINI